MSLLTLLRGSQVADLDLFRSYDATMRAGSLYATWKNANPGEASRYEAYAAAVLSGRQAFVPTMATATGKALVLAARMGANG